QSGRGERQKCGDDGSTPVRAEQPHQVQQADLTGGFVTRKAVRASGGRLVGRHTAAPPWSDSRSGSGSADIVEQHIPQSESIGRSMPGFGAVHRRDAAGPPTGAVGGPARCGRVSGQPVTGSLVVTGAGLVAVGGVWSSSS